MFVLNEFCYAKVYHIQKSSNLEENIVLIYFEHSVGTGFQAYFTYFGELKNDNGDVSTELSSEFEHEGKTIEYPLIVPTLSIKELDHLLSGEKATNEIYDKAESWAKSRIKEGKSPFAQPDELRMPAPKMSRGGLASRR